ncbi:hypothetical protein [Kineosporia babensis]|uniref:Serine/threonine protein kinase n=1 Tax=Kineosporia babensis TaxID=499548 RepID=A0A9X1NJ62_9ACTN|nr:hypothetical protein [Kineosporia babensis]MCD5314774.1 hypothetical protein [Kineosporia babensis]
MEPVLIDVLADPAQVIELPAGHSARFGRGAENVPVDITLTDPAVPRLAGEIRAVEDHWRLTNFSQTLTLVVENPEGAGEHVKVGPGRVAAPIPFEISRLVLPIDTSPAVLRIFAPSHTRLDHTGASLGGEPTISAFSLDPAARYFLILLALCEPRLRDESDAAIPSTAKVLERLRPVPGCAELTAEAVTFHVDYLVRSKLRIAQAAQGSGKREALVRLATRFDLVREEHLALLPERSRRPSG